MTSANRESALAQIIAKTPWPQTLEATYWQDPDGRCRIRCEDDLPQMIVEERIRVHAAMSRPRLAKTGVDWANRLIRDSIRWLDYFRGRNIPFPKPVSTFAEFDTICRRLLWLIAKPSLDPSVVIGGLSAGSSSSRSKAARAKRVSRESAAIAALIENPELTTSRLAEQVGCHPKHLLSKKRCPKLHALRSHLKETGRLPRGYLSNGTVIAVDHRETSIDFRR
jgi:hypothetical protein